MMNSTASEPGEKHRQKSFLDLLGFEIVQRDERSIKGMVKILPAHLNRAGIVHGGVYCTLIDAACCGAGLYCPHPGRIRRSVTLSLTTQFTGQSRGGVITAVGELQGSGRHIYTSRAEIRAEDGTPLAHGIGTFQYLPGSELGSGVPVPRS